MKSPAGSLNLTDHRLSFRITTIGEVTTEEMVSSFVSFLAAHPFPYGRPEAIQVTNPMKTVKASVLAETEEAQWEGPGIL